VHEKTILLPLLPIALLWYKHPGLSSWFGIIANFSMYPLFIKDHLEIPYFALQFVFLVVVYYINNDRTILQNLFGLTRSTNYQTQSWIILSYLSVFGCVLIHVVTAACPQKWYQRYPDLMTFLYVLYSFGHFVCFLFYLYLQQIYFLPRDTSQARIGEMAKKLK
jgi:alpha-1,3-glucosyltransferase